MKSLQLFSSIMLLIFFIACNNENGVNSNNKSTSESVVDSPAHKNLEATSQDIDIKVSQNEKYGKYLTDGKGRALYIFLADKKGETTCYNACAEAWPPLTVEGELQLGENIDSSKVDTIQRKTGETQITYAGWPLYYYVKDKQKGEFSGQDLEDFGAEWYLISPEGEKVHAESEES